MSKTYIIKKCIYHINTFLKTILSIYVCIKVYRKSNKKKLSNKDNIYILGNGPSLKNQLDYLVSKKIDSDFMCVNAFVLSKYYRILKPKYYLITAIAILGDEQNDELENGIGEIRGKIINNLIDKTDWKINLFIPSYAKENKLLIKKIKENNNINIVYMNTNIFEGYKTIKMYFLKKDMCVPYMVNVLVGAIYMALIMKYSNIYLLGCDHDWVKDISVNEKNELFINDKHFYNIDGKKCRWTTNAKKGMYQKMKDIYRNIFNLYLEYETLEVLSKKMNCQIINLSLDSWIDIFIKKKLE